MFTTNSSLSNLLICSQTYPNEEDVRNSDFDVKFGEEKVERIRRFN